jgi:uncharacterized protein
MTRIVIDTNILVSALFHPEGLPAAVFMLVLSGDVRLCVSDAIFAEYDQVIRRPRFKHLADVIEGMLRSIRKIGHWVRPNVCVDECADPDDNIFLECAEAAESDYPVTGNQRHFPEQWKKTEVISARELIELLMIETGK